MTADIRRSGGTPTAGALADMAGIPAYRPIDLLSAIAGTALTYGTPYPQLADRAGMVDGPPVISAITSVVLTDLHVRAMRTLGIAVGAFILSAIILRWPAAACRPGQPWPRSVLGGRDGAIRVRLMLSRNVGWGRA